MSSRRWVGVLCIGSVVVAAGFELSGSGAYRFLFGELSATLITLVTCALGGLSLVHLDRRGWFSWGDAERMQYAKIVALGLVLPLPVILVDLVGGFPADINLRSPDALAFYPAIAVVAQMVFHVIPLAVASLAWRASERAPRLALVIAVLIEPVLQVIWGAEQSPAWANAYVGIHLLAFNVVEVMIFRRFGFLPMYVFRFAYYVVWHIGWGHARLTLLFG